MKRIRIIEIYKGYVDVDVASDFAPRSSWIKKTEGEL
jgi:hypothetical protein